MRKAPNPTGKGLTPGNPKATGRPPAAWKEACKALASKQEVFDKAAQILDNPEHPAFLGAWKFLAEQGYGKPDATVNQNVTGTQVVKVYKDFDPSTDV